LNQGNRLLVLEQFMDCFKGSKGAAWACRHLHSSEVFAHRG
jgi:hypothetical protein